MSQNKINTMSDIDDYKTQEYVPQILTNNVLFNNLQIPIPQGTDAGAFGAVRKHDIHTGIDLYVPENTSVYALDDGIVIDISVFTGQLASPTSPWWNETYAVIVYHVNLNIFILYGEIQPINLKKYQIVEKGSLIGNVLKVLKKYKNKPMSMLHVEAYSYFDFTKFPFIHPVWHHNQPMPDSLLNPIKYIQ